MFNTDQIKDTDTHFIIDPLTRTITNTFSGNNTIVQYDHNSERFTFDIPRYVDGHDMFECTSVRIHYINSDATNWQKTEGVYIPDDFAIVDGDENMLTFTWLLSSATTQYAGYLHFSIQFARVEGEKLAYSWGTGTYKGVSVIESINNVEEIFTENVDALTAYKNEIINEVADKMGGITRSRIVYIGLSCERWVGEGSPYAQVVDIADVTESSQVDLTPSASQLDIFHEKDLAFVVENDGGTITVYAIGQKPKNDYVIQATVTEVVYD